MEDIEITVPANHCVICSVPLFQNACPEFISGSIHGYPPPSDLKLVNAFINCLTLDRNYVKDLTNNAFCLQCKTSLEEWDLRQNQIVQLQSRSRQLKASLIAKVLESPGQPVSDTWFKLDRNLKLIRQSIKQRFDPRVVLEASPPSDSSDSAQTQEFKTDIPTNSQDRPKLVSLVVAVSPKEFIHKGRKSFSKSSSLLQCGLCAFSCEDGDRGRAAIVSHMNTEHNSKTDDNMEAQVRSHQTSQLEGKSCNVEAGARCANYVQVKSEYDENFSEMDSDPLKLEHDNFVSIDYYVCKLNGCGMTFRTSAELYTHKNSSSHKVKCGRCLKVVTPRTLREKHKECKPASEKEKPKCKVCGKQYETHIKASNCFLLHKNPCEICNVPVANMYLNKHRGIEHGLPPLPFLSESVRETNPGEYLYRDKIPFYFKDERFTCGQCKVVIQGPGRSLERHLKCCEKRDVPRRTVDFHPGISPHPESKIAKTEDTALNVPGSDVMTNEFEDLHPRDDDDDSGDRDVDPLEQMKIEFDYSEEETGMRL